MKKGKISVLLYTQEKKGAKGYQYRCWQAFEQNNNPVSVR
jgi:hypothetical protein